MKYLSKYEKYNDYNVGDYILVKIYYSTSKTPKSSLYPTKTMSGKILKINISSYFSYIVIFDDTTEESIQKSCILRLLNPNEIEEYETKIQSIKYNL